MSASGRQGLLAHLSMATVTASTYWLNAKAEITNFDDLTVYSFSRQGLGRATSGNRNCDSRGRQVRRTRTAHVVDGINRAFRGRSIIIINSTVFAVPQVCTAQFGVLLTLFSDVVRLSS